MIEIGIAPDLVRVGGFLLTWHSAITAVSVLLAVFLIGRWAKREGLGDEIVFAVAPWAIAGGLIGARLLHVADNWTYYSSNPGQIPAIWSGGIAIFGAIAGGTLAGGAYAAWKRFPVRRLLDTSAPGLILAQGIGRLGDLVNGEHLSKPTDLPWAIAYTHPASPGFGQPPAHPAVGYEMLADLAFFGILWWLRGRLRPAGTLFAVYAGGYALIRLPLSFLRLDSNSVLLAINQQGWVSVIALAGAAIALLIFKPEFALVRPQQTVSPGFGGDSRVGSGRRKRRG